MLSPRKLPAVPRVEVNSTVGAGNEDTAQNDDVIVPSTPTLSRPTSPPLEFITPQAKQAKSRTSSLVDYTPTEEGGKKLREGPNVDPCGTPKSLLCTPVSKISKPGTPTINQENCQNTANQMTPFSATSPKLMLRTDEHVLRLVVDEAPAASPSLTKTSTVWTVGLQATQLHLCLWNFPRFTRLRRNNCFVLDGWNRIGRCPLVRR